MADKKSLIQWISQNRRQVELDAKEFDWAWKCGLSYYDFEVKLKINGFTGVGRGGDSKETTALEKAICEAIERSVGASLQFSSVGMACHTDEENARKNSHLEFVERHVFDWHLRERVSFIPVEVTENPFTEEIPTARFLTMRTSPSLSAVICFYSEGGEKFLGLGCSSSLERSAGKAALEVMRNCMAFRSNPDTFRETVSQDPNFWCCDKEFLETVEELLLAQATDAKPICEIPYSQTEVIGFSHLPALSGCPVVVTRCQAQEKAK